jgi:UDP-galactopyranose mutase
LKQDLLNSKYITVKVNTDYFQVKDKLKCGWLYYTGPIDAYFSHLGWPKLEYCSLDFEHIKRDTDYFQPISIGNHPSPENDFTHIVEYKHLLHQTSINTIYFIEWSKDRGEPYYPVPNNENKEQISLQ